MSDPGSQPPKAFISYSWSSSAHQAWVLRLATSLQESGVQVILDKWDLREGADKYKFMEKMVTDPLIRKVIVVCDRIYSEKANDRAGGVGTETQIISQEVYNQIDSTDQKQKFVALITERDEKGNPYIPVFLKSRIYIDMSEEQLYSEGFEQLLRWIFDKPLYKKPPLGKPPAFLIDPDKPSLNTTARHRFALDAIHQGKGTDAALRDYFETFATNLEAFRIQRQEGKEFDDQVLESIKDFLPYRNEAVEIFLALARHPPPEGYVSLHRFLERILSYTFRAHTPGMAISDLDQDNFKFIANELFLYAVAALLKDERFEGIHELTEQEYFRPYISGSGMIPFFFFAQPIRSFARRNRQVNLHGLMAEFFNKRAIFSELGLEDLMQADFVLFLIGDLHPALGYRWWPPTLMYAGDHPPFKIFARAQSKRYFNQLKVALGIEDKNALEKVNQDYQRGKLDIPWRYESFIDISTLMNLDKLATLP